VTDKDTLFLYRFNQSDDTIQEAEKMLTERFSTRSIINRIYYSMFYMLLALFLKTGINPNTSKHSRVISLFDREFINAGKIEKKYSNILHETFETKQEGDYKEYIEFSHIEAAEYLRNAKEFLERIKILLT
jgi:uncharacterized protein